MKGAHKKMKIDAVFSGGGVKAYSYIGVLQSLEKKGLEVSRIAGTSAGAIISALLIAGYTSNEIKKHLLSLSLKKFLDPPTYTSILPFSKWYNLFFKMGFYKGKQLEIWLREILARKNIYTFNDIKDDCLKIIVSDLSLKRLVVLPDDLKDVYGIQKNDFSIARAVRISAGYPLFFMPETINHQPALQKSLLVDGGIVSNFPLWVFKDELLRFKRPTLGVKIVGDNQEVQINNMVELLQAMLLTMKQSYDERYLDQNIKDILFLRVDSVETMNLSLGKKDKEKMISQAKERTDNFLQTWP